MPSPSSKARTPHAPLNHTSHSTHSPHRGRDVPLQFSSILFNHICLEIERERSTTKTKQAPKQRKWSKKNILERETQAIVHGRHGARGGGRRRSKNPIFTTAITIITYVDTIDSKQKENVGMSLHPGIRRPSLLLMEPPQDHPFLV